jgi:hypothetical protein
MNDGHDEDLIRLLRKLGDVQPAPEATAQALERVHSALEKYQTLTLPPSRKRRFKSYLAVAAAVLIVGSFITWLSLPSPASAWSAFTKVQANLRSPGSVVYWQTTRIKGEPDSKIRVLIFKDGLWRSERTDGSYTIVNAVSHQAMFVDPLKRQIKLSQNMSSQEDNIYDYIINVDHDVLALSLPPKKNYGKDWVGYAVNINERICTVWAKAKAIRPVQMDTCPVQIEMEWKDAQGRIVKTVLEQFAYGNELDPKLFAIEIVGGYDVHVEGNVGPLTAETEDPRFKDLVVTPLVGIGPVKYGMSSTEVEQLFGTPDKIDDGPKGSSILSYVASHGFSIQVNKESRVSAISCVARMVTRAHHFTGRTDKGIALGATKADILKAHGEPSTEETRANTTYIAYDDLQMHFTLISGSLIQIWSQPRLAASPAVLQVGGALIQIWSQPPVK